MYKQIKKLTSKIFPNFSRAIYYRFNIIRYKGNKYFCPVCENGFNKFLPGPDKLRLNSKCPGCGSLERQRLLWLYLKNMVQIDKHNIKLLNIAPDYATQKKMKKLNNLSYVSIDLNSELASEKQDITRLNFSDNSFDAILCYHVLEHVADDKKAMKELFRVLKSEGWAIIQTPYEKNRKITFEDFSITSPKEREEVFGQEDHVRIYGLDYFNRLQDTGFILNVDNYINQLSAEEINKYLLDKEEDICFCIKP